MLKRIKKYFEVKRQLKKLNRSYYNLSVTEKAILLLWDSSKPSTYLKNLFNEVTAMMEKLEPQIKITKMKLDSLKFWY